MYSPEMKITDALPTRSSKKDGTLPVKSLNATRRIKHHSNIVSKIKWHDKNILAISSSRVLTNIQVFKLHNVCYLSWDCKSQIIHTCSQEQNRAIMNKKYFVLQNTRQIFLCIPKSMICKV